MDTLEGNTKQIVNPRSGQALEEDKFPVKKVAAVAVALLVNFICIQLIYPFLPFMVKSFFPDVIHMLFYRVIQTNWEQRQDGLAVHTK